MTAKTSEAPRVSTSVWRKLGQEDSSVESTAYGTRKTEH